MQHKVKQFLGEKSGKQLRADIYSSNDGYFVQYFVDDYLQTTETFYGKSIHFVESAAENWISGIKVLFG